VKKELAGVGDSDSPSSSRIRASSPSAV